MYSLRLANEADEDAIINLARACVSELPLPYSFSEDWVKGIVRKVLKGTKNKAVIILVCHNTSPVGILGAVVEAQMWSDTLQAFEAILYIDKNHRGLKPSRLLMQAYKYWAKLVGAKYISYASYKNGIEMNRIRKL